MSRNILIFLIAILPAAQAQEGHPLSGSWHGQVKAGAETNPVMIAMKWDSKNVVGTINPGRNAMELKVVNLDPSKWTVHMEADGKDKGGSPVHVVIDGKLDNLGSYNRTITGTWTQGSTKSEFKIARD